ncbi:uncharacterized protein LOC126668619 [Mercurialis annua]|uniref:uncharacterized protein LOC126668619 n=1 Tax=Mercurialis annua TaxID=3986 RepID=UPI00215F0571|nr:uncharacterized protein LOC126668619 [Mercurialis annua]
MGQKSQDVIRKLCPDTDSSGNLSPSLIDLPLQSRHFTWKNRNSKSKLDRCFTSSSFLATWQNSALQALPRSHSDHTPIIFKSEVVSDWGPKPFKSINAWWEHHDFPSFISTSWNNISNKFPIADLVVKLRELHLRIKVWNKEVFGDLNLRLSNVEQAIHELDVSSDFNDLTDLDLSRLAILRAENDLISKQLESLWHQKSRLKWNLSGDRNANFFHTTASVHSKINHISELSINGTQFSTVSAIKDQVHVFYKLLYKRPFYIEFSLDFLSVLTLSDQQADSLVTGFSKEEPDILSLFKQFQQTGEIPKGINTAFLVLIPKFSGASYLSDFRPISLINGVLKLLSKVLANRLSPLMPVIISANQFGFIKGRNIHDCHMIASEILHLANRRRDQLFLIKMDFKTAFDSISWNFILKIMARMNFPKTWIDWISSLFLSSQLSVLVNGSPTQNFFMGKGVRQGDLLSPMLFVLAAEGLKAMIDKAISLALLDGVHIDGYSEPASILQFADDTLIFVPKDLSMIENLLRILRCFELVSGLQINFKKSSILGVNVDETSLQSAACILNCPIDSFPIMYLGLPLALRPVKAALWKPVVSNFNAQLASWKGNLLSPAGRLILVKSVSSSLPVYYMCSFYIPRSVMVLLDRCMKRFLWCGSSDGKGLCKVSWSKERNYSSLSHSWRGIFKACVKDSSQWDSFSSAVIFRVGSGETIKFWDDMWLGNQCLKDRFPFLYRNGRYKQHRVTDFLGSRAAVFPPSSWNRRLRVGEQEELNSLLLDLQSVTISAARDEAAWQKYGTVFTVKSMSTKLQEAMGSLGPQINRGIFIPSIWNQKIPP